MPCSSAFASSSGLRWKVPAFVAEMGRDENRAKLQAGVYTGYGTALLFGGLAWYAAAHGLIPAPRAASGG